MLITSNLQTTWRPGEAVGPALPRPSGTMSTPKKLLLGAIAILFFPVLMMTLGSLFGDDLADKDRPDSSAEVVDPTKGMTKAERALAASVGFYVCDPLRGSSRPDGAKAAVRCDATATRFNKDYDQVPYGTKMIATYYQYGSYQAAKKAYWDRYEVLDSAENPAVVKSEAGWCNTSSPFNFGCGHIDGRVTFYKKGDHVFALWTEPKGVLAEAERFDDRMEKFRTIWFDEW